MEKNEENKNNKSNKSFGRFIKVLGLMILCIAALMFAPNFIKDKYSNKVHLIINNNDVTGSTKKDVLIKKEVVYLSMDDMDNYFDSTIYYDKKYNQIITTSNDKVATLKINDKNMILNNSKVNLFESAIEKDNIYYLPISEMESVYNIKVNYNKDENIIIIDSLDREQKMGNSSKNANVKYKMINFSKTIEKLSKGDSLVVISEKGGWYKIRTNNGNIGYLKDVANIRVVRENMEKENQVNTKVSMVWDYFSEYVSAPNRSGTKLEGVNVVSPSFAVLVENGNGKLKTNIGSAGEEYIAWAHSQGYKVWPMISNNSLIDTTSTILNDYKLRQELINNIANLAITYKFDGINIDFENMYEKDKDMYTRLITELAPRLKEFGMVTTVDVTAPDGGETWSMCFDRHDLSNVCDYLAFMAYDQYGTSNTKIGTTAGENWIRANINKFLGQEGVKKEKIILGLPFYTRLWKEENSKISSSAISMNSIDTTIPSGVEKQWQDDLKQNYVKYSNNGATYKMWIEDVKSLGYKLDLINEYDLAGAAYWAKDRETNDVWNLVKQKLDI